MCGEQKSLTMPGSTFELRVASDIARLEIVQISTGAFQLNLARI
jgi:hypothetical protein